LLGRDLRLRGAIRLTAPEGVALHLLGPWLNRFCREHPEITIEQAITSSDLELSRREADLAVRVTPAPPDTTLGRRLCRFAICAYASRQYLERNPHGRLEDYDWLLPNDSIEWFMPGVLKKHGRPRVRRVMSGNNTTLLIEAARAGLGVVPLPCFWGDREKNLLRLIEPPEDSKLELWFLTHPDLRNTARVRALMTFLHNSLEDSIDLIEGREGKASR